MNELPIEQLIEYLEQRQQTFSVHSAEHGTLGFTAKILRQHLAKLETTPSGDAQQEPAPPPAES
jgi:hypothetical protein